MQVFSTSKRSIQNGNFVSVTRTRWSKATRKFKRLIGRWEHQSLSIYSCKVKRFTEAKKRAHTPSPSGFGGTYFLRFTKEWGSKWYVRFSQSKGETARANTKAKKCRGKDKDKGLWLTCPNPIGKSNHAIQCVTGSAILSAPYEVW